MVSFRRIVLACLCDKSRQLAESSHKTKFRRNNHVKNKLEIYGIACAGRVVNARRRKNDEGLRDSSDSAAAFRFSVQAGDNYGLQHACARPNWLVQQLAGPVSASLGPVCVI